MKRIKLNIEIELEGNEADTFVRRLESLGELLTGSATVSTESAPAMLKPTEKVVKTKVSSPKPKKVVKTQVSSPKPKKVVKSEPRKSGRKPFARGTFVEAWNNSERTKEVAKKLGLSPAAVSSRAAKLRSEGVNLKKFKRGRPPKNN